MTGDLLTTARAWADDDPHPGDRAEIEALIEAYGEPDLSDPVHARVGGEFTTAEFDAEPGTTR